MKLPKTFTSEKNLDKHVERLLSEKPNLKDYNENTVRILLKKCRTFLDKQEYTRSLLKVYPLGEDLVKKLDFTKGDIEEASRRIESYSHEDKYAGFYLSALVNKIITEQDIITLKFDVDLFGIGAYLKTGKLIIDGYVGHFLGYCMEGGEVITKKDAGHDVGNGMQAGKIIINGEVGCSTGIFSEGGDIIVYGNIEKIADSCKARIHKWGKQVWPR